MITGGAMKRTKQGNVLKSVDGSSRVSSGEGDQRGLCEMILEMNTE